MDPLLERARDHFGRRRFYPPGQHPAIQRERGILAKLEDFKHAGVGDSETRTKVEEAITHHADRIAQFEEGESLSKAHYLAKVTK